MPEKNLLARTSFFNTDYSLDRATGIWRETPSGCWLVADSFGLWLGHCNGSYLAGKLTSLTEQSEPLVRLKRKHAGVTTPNFQYRERWGMVLPSQSLIADQTGGSPQLKHYQTARAPVIVSKSSRLPPKLTDYLDWYLPIYLSQTAWIDPRPLLEICTLAKDLDRGFVKQIYQRLTNQLKSDFSVKAGSDLQALSRQAAIKAWWLSHMEVLLGLQQIAQTLRLKPTPVLAAQLKRQLESDTLLVGWDLPWFSSLMPLTRMAVPPVAIQEILEAIRMVSLPVPQDIQAYPKRVKAVRKPRPSWPLAIEDCAEILRNLYSA